MIGVGGFGQVGEHGESDLLLIGSRGGAHRVASRPERQRLLALGGPGRGPAGQVRQRPGDGSDVPGPQVADHPEVGGMADEGQAVISGGIGAVQLAARNVTIAPPRCGGQPLGHAVPGFGHPRRGPGIGILARLAAGDLGGLGLPGHQAERKPGPQRAGDPLMVAAGLQRCAGTPADAAARAGPHPGQQDEPGREPGGTAATRDDHLPAGQRLPERVQDPALELGCVRQAQHAAVRQRRLTRPQIGATAGHRRHRAPVVAGRAAAAG